MLPFKTLIRIEENKIPVYRQIAESVIHHICEGTIRPGVSLPSSRAMAGLLGVHRNTVSAAYEELAAQNWVTSIPRKGIKIADDLPLVHPVRYQPVTVDSSGNNNARFAFDTYHFPGQFRQAPVINRHSIIINDGFPDIELAPVDLIQREYRRQLDNRQLKKSMYLRDQGGTDGLKSATRDFLNDSRGLNIEEKNILLTRGAQMAIYVAASLIVKPGDKVVVSEPNYFIANAVFEKLGAELIAVPSDENGMVTERIEEFVRANEIRLIYVIPHHHNPTTFTMSPTRRALLLELINRHNIPLIEDDYDYDFHYEHKPVMPLASGNHNGNVIYVGSYTKLLAPSFRIGYMVAAENFIAEAITHRRLMDLRGDVIMEESLARLITTGELTRHIKRSLKIYEQRRDMMHTMLENTFAGSACFTVPTGGLAFWVKFSGNIPLARIIDKAAAGNVILNGSVHENYNALRMGFASLEKRDMEKAFSVLKKIVRV